MEVQKFTRYQKFVVAILAFLQFTIILDFMIISPLGAILMPSLHISPAEFGTIVSAYAFSAGISGFLAAGIADRFDRKRLLLFFYVGFIVGTLCCGLASDFHFLLLSRIVTGVFGGVIGSIVLAITTDLFPIQMRGRVMGIIQTAFAASQILGIPAGLYLATLWNWHAAFIMIVVICLFAGLFIVMYLQPIDGHLKYKSEKNVVAHLVATVSNRDYTLAFLTTALLSTGGYMLMPFGSAFAVGNLGVAMADLPMIYLVTGVGTIFMGPLIGRLADQYGKYKVFVCGGISSIVMVVIYTNLGITSLPMVMLIYVVLFAAIFSRIIPAQALTSAIPDPAHRGSFMAVNVSLQQMAGGVASIIAGLIVVNNDGKIEHFDDLGYIIVCTNILTIGSMYFIDKNLRLKLHKATV